MRTIISFFLLFLGGCTPTWTWETYHRADITIEVNPMEGEGLAGRWELGPADDELRRTKLGVYDYESDIDLVARVTAGVNGLCLEEDTVVQIQAYGERAFSGGPGEGEIAVQDHADFDRWGVYELWDHEYAGQGEEEALTGDLVVDVELENLCTGERVPHRIEIDWVFDPESRRDHVDSSSPGTPGVGG